MHMYVCTWGSVYARVCVCMCITGSLRASLSEHLSCSPYPPFPILVSLQISAPLSVSVLPLYLSQSLRVPFSFLLCCRLSSIPLSLSLRFPLLLSQDLSVCINISLSLFLSSQFLNLLSTGIQPTPSSAGLWSPHPASFLSPTCAPILSQSHLIPPFQAKGRESGPD